MITLGPAGSAGSYHLLKILILTTVAKSLLPCKATYLEVPGISMWTCLRVASARFTLPQLLLFLLNPTVLLKKSEFNMPELFLKFLLF